MRCLVTGAAGFIGSHLCDRLIADGHTVMGVDNLSVGRVANLSQALKSDRFTFEKADLSSRLSKHGHWMRQYCRGTDWVFHLAALADIVPSIEDPVDYHRSNVEGTIHLLEAARIEGIKKLVYAASSSCYGIPSKYPTDENAPRSPQYPYALTKDIGEQYVRHYFQVYNLPTVALRLFNVYGPRARTSGTYGAVFGVFLSQLFHGLPLTVVGDGNQTRDFTYVSDVVNAFVMAAESELYGLCGQALNVGSGQPHSVNELISLLGAKKVEHIPKRPGEPDCTWADITKIESMLGWSPKVSFESGVKIMLEHVQDFRDAPLWSPDTIGKATKDWFRCLGREGSPQ